MPMGSSRFRPRRSARKSTDEQIMPLINIVFLLLAFFMIAGQLSNHSPFPLAPPRSLSELADRPMDSTLFVSAEGQLSLGGDSQGPVDLEALHTRLPDGMPLRVSADANTSASLILPILARLREAGWKEVVLVTRRPH